MKMKSGSTCISMCLGGSGKHCVMDASTAAQRDASVVRNWSRPWWISAALRKYVHASPQRPSLCSSVASSW